MLGRFLLQFRRDSRHRWRGLAVATAVVALAVGAVPGPVNAQPTEAPGDGASVPPPKPGQELCTIKGDARNKPYELSGLVQTSTGYVALNDGNSRLAIDLFLLDGTCKITGKRAVDLQGVDPEDLGRSADGTLWVADIGDNDDKRDNVSLFKLPPGKGTGGTRYRLRYPDGAHDAEALLMAADGTPIIVTKMGGAVYTPAAKLDPGKTNELKKVGDFKPRKTGTKGGPQKALGQGGQMITGGAVAPDGKRIALRTYTDAYEWNVADAAPDKIIEAVTKGTPRLTPLPDEPQGEAITYTTDGKSFVTVSETSDLPANVVPTLKAYVPTAPAPAAAPTGSAAAAAKKSGPAWNLSVRDISYLIAGVGVIGLVLVVAGIFGIRRARARRRAGTAGAVARQPASGPASGSASVAGAAQPAGRAPVRGRATVGSSGDVDHDLGQV